MTELSKEVVAGLHEFWRQRAAAEAAGVIPPAHVRYHWSAVDYKIMADKLDDAGYPSVAAAFRNADC